MPGTFAGWTSQQYAAHRRDLPDEAVDQLVAHFALDRRSLVVDLGAGTGQAAVPLARHVGTVVAVEPEPDQLGRLLARPDRPGNVLGVQAADRDLPVLTQVLGGPRVDLLVVTNALHLMDPASMLADARAMVSPAGGVAVVGHGFPLWLAETDWAHAVRRFLADWLGVSASGSCGLDDAARAERARLLRAAGFAEVTELRHEYDAPLTEDYVVGHLYSALSEGQVPPERRADFEAGVRHALAGREDPLVEHVPVVTLAARPGPREERG